MTWVLLLMKNLILNFITNNTIKKASAKLGFIKRSYKDFHEAPALKLLYFSIVLFRLEYANLYGTLTLLIKISSKFKIVFLYFYVFITKYVELLIQITIFR